MVLDFNVDIHANADSVDSGPEMELTLEPICDVTRKDLVIPPGESLPGGASSVETFPGGTLPETSSPSSAPDPMPAGDQAAPEPSPAPSPAPSEAAARRTAHSAPRSEPALTRARAANVTPRRQTHSGTTSLAAVYENIAHHLGNASLFASTLTSPSLQPETIRGGGQTEGPEHFQGGYEPPSSGTMEGGGKQGDRQPKKAHRPQILFRSRASEGRKGHIHFVKTEQQLADLGTKHLNKHCHRFLIKLINEFRA